MTDELDKLARETAAKLIPHTTSVHNVSVIADALTRAKEMGRAAQSASVPEGTIDIDATNKYHSDLDEARAQVASLTAENAVLRTVLGDAKEKLALYRAEHSGIYIGGVEYQALVKRIDSALSTPSPAADITKDTPRALIFDSKTQD